jgi:GNAT superfamily N-acetyltransferase
MKFVIGYDFDEFEKYYKTLNDLHDYFRTIGLTDVTFGQIGDIEKLLIKTDPSHLIVWKQNNEIIGHAIWHESSTDEHRKGAPRDKEDKQTLTHLIGTKKTFIELHEIWLKTKHRRKGYGKKFFQFFENFTTKQGYNSIIYYTDNPAAIAICRKRGYKEAYLEKEKWHIFYLNLAEKVTPTK